MINNALDIISVLTTRTRSRVPYFTCRVGYPHLFGELGVLMSTSTGSSAAVPVL